MESSVEPGTRAKVFAPWVGIPLLAMLIGLGPVMIGACACKSVWMGWAGIALYFAGVLYLLVQTIGRLILRQWLGAFWATLRLLVCLVPVGMVVMFVMAFRSEDGFAKDLTIPADLEVAEPLPKPTKGYGGLEDPFQQALLEAWAVEPTADPCVVPSIPSLRTLGSQHRPLLLRYLATSPAWRVFEERGILCATRRWRLGTMWLWKLHGYYSRREVRPWPYPDMLSLMRASKQAAADNNSLKASPDGGVTWTDGPAARFQVRTTIGLEGKPSASSQRNDAWLEEGTAPHPIALKARWPFDSHIVIRCGPVVVELFEQAEGPERRLTKAALRALEAEFKALLDRRGSMPALLPVDAVRRGDPVLNLHEGMQPGIYEVEVWINPGEAGAVYLKAFEVTRGTRLSSHDLRRYSNERTGWSEDPNELFYSNTRITIYEGDWGDPYAARFELWFVPDSGKTERKLLERVFKIEGWQR
ncbi:MAG: hypothetical protein JW741_30530 [Sedimentisphaerales bacterium]|nr:hypothetical protein [Sedimentisphaerales bacterium]